MPQKCSSSSRSSSDSSYSSIPQRKSKPDKRTNFRHKIDHNFDSKFVTKRDKKGRVKDMDFSWTRSLSHSFDYSVSLDLEKWQRDRLNKYNPKTKPKNKYKNKSTYKPKNKPKNKKLHSK
jgi:hypothetical protein